MPSNALKDAETTKSNPMAKQASLSEGPPRNSKHNSHMARVVQPSHAHGQVLLQSQVLACASPAQGLQMPVYLRGYTMQVYHISH